MSLKDFFKECHKRDVFKLLTIYIVTSWVILQVLSVIWQPLNLPEKSVTYLIIILLVGFPLYIFFLWKSRVRNSKKTEGLSLEAGIKHEISFKRKYFISLSIISALCLTSVAIIFDNALSDGIKISKLVGTNKIAVLNFVNNTGDKTMDDIGKMAADWLIFGITENEAGEVISSEVVESYSDLLGVQMSPKQSTNILKKYLNPNKVIQGAYFLNNKTLILRCTIKDVSSDETLHTFGQIECDSGNALDCIEELRQEVVGYLTATGETQTILEENPPKFAAYQKVLDAKAMYENPDEYLKLLNQAIGIDNSYFEPKILRIQHYYNIENYDIADSLIKAISKGQRRSKQQLNILNFLEGVLDGNNSKAFNFHNEYFKKVPSDLVASQSQMTMAMQFVNKPNLVPDMFDDINISDFILEDCYFCKSRYFSLAMAYNRLGEYQKAIDLLEPVMYEADDLFMFRAYVSAVIKGGEFEKLNEFLSRISLMSNESRIIGLKLYAGKRYVLIGDKESADKYFDLVIAQTNSINSNSANAYFFKEDYKQAEIHFQALFSENPLLIDVITKLAISKYKNGNMDKATNLINSLNELRGDYQYGSIDYGFAQYFASTGNKEKALTHLQESVAQGNFFVPGSFENDILFLSIKHTPKFQEILTYWHKFLK